MTPPRLEESVTIAAAPERVFAWADDPPDTGWHMRRRSLAILGADLKLEQVSAAAHGVGATYRRSGSVLGLTVNFTGTVIRWVALGAGVPAGSDVYRAKPKDAQDGTSTVPGSRGRV